MATFTVTGIVSKASVGSELQPGAREITCNGVSKGKSLAFVLAIPRDVESTGFDPLEFISLNDSITLEVTTP